MALLLLHQGQLGGQGTDLFLRPDPLGDIRGQDGDPTDIISRQPVQGELDRQAGSFTGLQTELASGGSLPGSLEHLVEGQLVLRDDQVPEVAADQFIGVHPGPCRQNRDCSKRSSHPESG